MHNKLTQYWYSKHPILYLLLPFAWIYQIIITLRRWLYQKQIFRVHKFNVPIIVVGNITVGGTGKTPLVVHLAKQLQQKGYKPGIISRGYGGKTKKFPQLVTINSDPGLVGDEVVLLAQLTKVPIAIAPKRYLAVQLLLKEQKCNIILSDDGLQHYALARTIEIAVIDGTRGLGNNFCLPAGPLREPKKRLQTVNQIVINGPASFSTSTLTSNNIVSMQLIPGHIYNLKNPLQKLAPITVQNKIIHAIAGIGNPARFFQQLRELGLNIIEHPFPDHYSYDAHDFDFAGKDTLIIMTEKDAVKCNRFADQRFWVLPITVNLEDAFLDQIF